MAFIVNRTFNNGYRCGCCHSTSDYTKLVQTWEEALALIPRNPFIKKIDEDAVIADRELEYIEVTDGSDLTCMAKLRLEYGIGPSKRDNYSYSRWHGFIGAEHVDITDGLHDGESWEQAVSRLSRQATEEKIKNNREAALKLDAELIRLNNELGKV